ncbi:MAG TPA: two-component system response regulator [Ectothiorhodospiraceae bacterium]|nr:two-component system response regulator [Ectothiorhodospiraceae bacterium]
MSDKPTILVVDDTPDNLMLLSSLLKGTYKTKLINSGEKALEVVSKGDLPDLVLLDIMMPGVDGYEVCRQLKANERTREVPVIFLTAKAQVADEQKGLELGAVDYITKPISPPILLERVKNHLALKQAKDYLKNENKILEQKVRQRTEQLSKMQDVSMVAMGALAEARDPETGNHIRRTAYYVEVLAQQLEEHPRFSELLTPENITLITKSSPLHDIGKVGVADAILLKPGKLTFDEFEEIKLHSTYGRDAIAAAEASSGDNGNFLRFAKEIAYSHHEKWDGTGYPEGLQGDAIPISARIMALADVYDALISVRPYKKPFTHEDAREIILKGKGVHFDSDVVDAFLATEDQFLAISRRFTD